MFTMLLANSEGRAYLTDSKLLKEIALNLEELDPVFPSIFDLTIARPKSTWRTLFLQGGFGRYHDLRLLCHVRNIIRPQRRSSNA
jgi:hypothetical protein